MTFRRAQQTSEGRYNSMEGFSLKCSHSGGRLPAVVTAVLWCHLGPRHRYYHQEHVT